MAGEKGKRGKRKRRQRKPDNPAQPKRFIEAAKRLGVDESGEAFHKALHDVLKPKKGDGNN
jgi:hypothetical protein